jgi:flagellar hook-associated protein 3 FlgL
MSSSFYPIVAGRVSDVLNRTRALSQMQYDQIALNRLQAQISTGSRFQRPSEDPAAAIRILALQRQQEVQEQSIINLKSADSYLSVSENSLASLTTSLQQIKQYALEAVTNVTTQADRETLAVQVEDQLTRILAISNQAFQDRYLFSGGLVKQKPYSNTNVGVEFLGNDLQLESFGLESTTVTHNVDGLAVFGGLSTSVVGLTDLNPRIQATTKLSSLNSGTGVGKGAIQISDGTSIVQVDLTDAHRVSDVLNKINSISLGGRAVQATLTANGLQINYADSNAGTIRIGNVGAGNVATELGIETTVASPALPIVGSNLRSTLSAQAPLANLFGGSGLSSFAGIKIQQGNQSHSIDFAGATTIEDILIKINNSGAKVRASIADDGRRIQIQSTLSGVDFSISETTGTTASQLGLKTFHGNLRLDDLNFGEGIHRGDGTDLEFTRIDGTVFNVDLSSAVTVNDAINLINNHVDNQTAATKITASINPIGNGLVLSAPEAVLPAVGAAIKVRNAGGSQAAIGLGFVAKGQTEATASLNAGIYSLNGTDVNPQEVKGVYNSLIRLREAIRAGDSESLTRITEEIESDLDRVSLVRGQVGIQQQRVDALKTSNEDQLIQVAEDKSELLDTDYAQAIADLSAKQTAYQASLELLANLMKGANLFQYI